MRQRHENDATNGRAARRAARRSNRRFIARRARSSWKLFAGYQFNRNFALGLGYTDLGEVTASTLAMGFMARQRRSAYGKLGLYRADTDISVNFAGLGSVTDSDSNTDLTFGLGVRFDITPRLGARLEWQRYSGVAAGDFDEGDVDVISLGLAWRF